MKAYTIWLKPSKLIVQSNETKYTLFLASICILNCILINSTRILRWIFAILQMFSIYECGMGLLLYNVCESYYSRISMCRSMKCVSGYSHIVFYLVLRLTVDGIIGTQCPSTYMASSLENGWEPSEISPLLCRLRLTNLDKYIVVRRNFKYQT